MERGKIRPVSARFLSRIGGFVLVPNWKHDTRALPVQITRYRSELLFERKGKKERKKRDATRREYVVGQITTAPLSRVEIEIQRRSGKSVDFSFLLTIYSKIFFARLF